MDPSRVHSCRLNLPLADRLQRASKPNGKRQIRARKVTFHLLSAQRNFSHLGVPTSHFYFPVQQNYEV
uniref:Uncharacterized protein n=1 Tax=Anguilla anguilla TaxID=7936 RepID=A0A0E9WEL8_ANGAN